MKGDKKFTKKGQEQLRQAVILKLVQQDEVDPSLFEKGGHENYSLVEDIIRERVKEILRVSDIPGLTIADLQARTKDGRKVIPFGTHAIRNLLYTVNKDPTLKLSMRKSNHAIFCLYAFGELVEEYPDLPIGISSLPVVSPKDAPSIGYHPKLDQLRNKLRKGERMIRILETYIDTENWFRIRKDLRAANGNGCRIELLVCHPESEVVMQRTADLRRTRNISEGIREFLKRIDEDVQTWEEPENVEIKLFHSLPGPPSYLIDDQYFVGWFWHQQASFEGPYLEVMAEAHLGQTLTAHFTSLWEAAQPFDIENLTAYWFKPEVLGLEAYPGTWYLYCNRGEIIPRNQGNGRTSNDALGMVVRSVFHILEERHKHGYRCTLEAPHILPAKMEGWVSVLPNRSFFEARLFAPGEKSFISLVVHIGSGIRDNLTGLFTSMYSEEPILNAGLFCLVRTTETDPQLGIPATQSKQELQSSAAEAKEITQSADESLIQNYLRFSERSRLHSYKDFYDLRENYPYSNICKYAGVYTVFAYYEKEEGEDGYITVGVMELTNSYAVRHKRVHPVKPNESIEATGKVISKYLHNEQMVIELKSKRNKGAERLGYFILNIPPHEPNDGTYASGVFAGFDSVNRKALGNRLVLKYESADPAAYERLTPFLGEMYGANRNIPIAISQSLQGRVNNYISFNNVKGIISRKRLERENDAALETGKIFFESACYRAMQDNLSIKSVVEQLTRAYHHGYLPCKAFEQTMRSYQAKRPFSRGKFEDILQDPAYQALKAKELAVGSGVTDK